VQNHWRLVVCDILIVFLDRKKQFAQVYQYIADQKVECVLGGESCEMVYKQPKAFTHCWTLFDEADSSASEMDEFRSFELTKTQTSSTNISVQSNVSSSSSANVVHTNVNPNINTIALTNANSNSSANTNANGIPNLTNINTNVNANATQENPLVKTPASYRRASFPSPFFRPSFISLNSDDLLLGDIRAKQDKGVFNLIHNARWKVENIEFVEVVDEEKMFVNIEDLDDAEADESKDEETDQFGDDIICRAQCVYFTR